MVNVLRQNADALDTAIAAHTEPALTFLDALIAQPSVLGNEEGALNLLAGELETLGFEPAWFPIPEDIAGLPYAAIPPSHAQDTPRRALVATKPGADPQAGRSLLINGHLDVVPSGDPTRWASDPFTPVRRDGWLYGRGAGDMKGGWAMVVLALRALKDVAPNPAGDLIVVGAIEEECGGNGTLATVNAGVRADAALLPEPSDLELLTAGNGVLWLDVEVRGSLGHAESAHTGSSALDAAWSVVGSLRELTAEFERDAPSGAHYNVNVGVFEAGDWPSTVPGAARLRVRVGFPPSMSPGDAEQRVREVVDHAARADPWLADNPPAITPSGFRAEAYELDPNDPLIEAIADAHEHAHGNRPGIISTNGTTDARFYLNQAGMPALCYGPHAQRIHGVDEAVELDSIVAGARTVARFMDAWLNGGG
jgi:acetylornithine deacetylase